MKELLIAVRSTAAPATSPSRPMADIPRWPSSPRSAGPSEIPAHGHRPRHKNPCLQVDPAGASADRWSSSVSLTSQGTGVGHTSPEPSKCFNALHTDPSPRSWPIMRGRRPPIPTSGVVGYRGRGRAFCSGLASQRALPRERSARRSNRHWIRGLIASRTWTSLCLGAAGGGGYFHRGGLQLAVALRTCPGHRRRRPRAWRHPPWRCSEDSILAPARLIARRAKELTSSTITVAPDAALGMVLVNWVARGRGEAQLAESFYKASMPRAPPRTRQRLLHTPRFHPTRATLIRTGGPAGLLTSWEIEAANRSWTPQEGLPLRSAPG